MSWKPARFKGKKVWAAVNAIGEMDASNGLVPIRYSANEGATVYRASARNLTLDGGDATELPGGTQAAGEVRSKSSRFGSSHTRSDTQKKAAQQDVRQFLDGLSTETIRCFTDGSCQGNPGPSGTGVYIQIGEEEIRHHRYLGEGTNNIAELSAVYDALVILEERGVASDAAIIICTDSRYVEGILSKNWKAKANRQLITELRAKMRGFSNARIRWVAGHADIPENEEADRLANQALTEQQS
jgi:ribonuclease HI